jgi:hypothetical protein
MYMGSPTSPISPSRGLISKSVISATNAVNALGNIEFIIPPTFHMTKSTSLTSLPMRSLSPPLRGAMLLTSPILIKLMDLAMPWKNGLNPHSDAAYMTPESASNRRPWPSRCDDLLKSPLVTSCRE